MTRKILMTADTVGGVWNYSLDLARCLTERGIQVSLATMGALLSSDQVRSAEAIRGLTLYESNYKLEWMADPWSDVRKAGRWLLSLEDAVRPDVVHLNGFCHAALCWSAPTVVVFHSCVLSWFEAVKRQSAPENWYRYRQEVAKGLRAAKYLVAPTRAMLNTANRLYGPFKRSIAIPNTADANRFRSDSKEPFVFSAGRLWDEAKNVQALDRIAGELPWPVYVAGDGNSNPSESSLRRLGKLPSRDIAHWLGRASIYALPARYEPFGLSILEAALSGCALVLGDIPSLRENWTDCALFVDPEDPSALKFAIQTLIDNPDQRARLGDAARRRGLCFDPSTFADSYLGVYRELLDSSPSAVSLAQQAFAS
ncbi:glycosyltransferase family 4 protein [Fimbriimonas ginsengisoli]|uniref:Glycosyl transferase group 1 n=1 Tax=Fimbriimonas ginsengisoli Gsoil 348 TaxID=661478 RepID=A0A068NT22_FIMGI|nr:glycosyltransferase family 4 protein [Fimbriimonas ginsengisoli]AIE86688.1 glycosyl transferase group 1 [Fimbriimonas ginsengisoli Gsoil 348]